MQTQNFHQQQGSQRQQSLTPSEIVLFSRLNNHLLFHFTSLVQFWQTQRLCVTLDEFQGMLEKIGFFKGKQEIEEMRQNGIEFIGLDRVLIGVKQWKSVEGDIVTFMGKQQQYLSQHKQKQKQSQQHNKRHRAISSVQTRQKIKSIKTGGNLHSQRFQHLNSQRATKQNKQNSSSRVTNRTTHSISQYYLQQTSKKQHKALLDLNSTLIRTKNQSQYQLAIKIGELNDICKRLKNKFTYIILTNESGDIEIVQKSNKTDMSKIISQKMFQKRYQEFKLQSNNLVDQIEGTLEKDLRETLVEVMYLSDQLEKQISLLKRKGINMV